jgi:hypothetical protein
VEGEPGFILSLLPPDVTSGLTALEVDMRPAAPPTGPPGALPIGQQFQVPPPAQEIQAIVASSSLATWPEHSETCCTDGVSEIFQGSCANRTRRRGFDRALTDLRPQRERRSLAGEAPNRLEEPRHVQGLVKGVVEIPMIEP